MKISELTLKFYKRNFLIKEIPVEKNCPYKRSNIKMELLLVDKS